MTGVRAHPCISYFQGAAEGCPKVLMTDQIKCLPDDTKCIEDWGPLYAKNKIAGPAETSAELLSLECVRLCRVLDALGRMHTRVMAAVIMGRLLLFVI